VNFFRVQGKGISLEQMKSHDSTDGGDGYDVSLAVSSRPDGRFGGAWDAMNDDDELVVLRGQIIVEIYDGYRIRPTEEVARFTIAEWEKMLEDGTAWDYEDWS